MQRRVGGLTFCGVVQAPSEDRFMVADEPCNTIGRIDTTNNQEMVAEIVCDSLTLSNTTMMRINMRDEKMEHILDPKSERHCYVGYISNSRKSTQVEAAKNTVHHTAIGGEPRPRSSSSSKKKVASCVDIPKSSNESNESDFFVATVDIREEARVGNGMQVLFAGTVG